MGNQGVGKNKLADRLLQLLNRPREYIQLHRSVFHEVLLDIMTFLQRLKYGKVIENVTF